MSSNLLRTYASCMDEKLAKTIGSLVKAARTKRGLTQPQLAERIGKAYETISNIERGFKPPAIQTLADMAVALDVPITDFFDSKLLAKPSDQKQALIDQLHKQASAMSNEELRMLIKLAEAVRDE